MSYGLQVCSDAEVGSSQSSYSCTPKIICDLYHVHYIKETTFIYIHIYVLYVIYVLSSGTNSRNFGAQNSGNKRKKRFFGDCHGYKPAFKSSFFCSESVTATSLCRKYMISDLRYIFASAVFCSSDSSVSPPPCIAHNSSCPRQMLVSLWSLH